MTLQKSFTFTRTKGEQQYTYIFEEHNDKGHKFLTVQRLGRQGDPVVRVEFGERGISKGGYEVEITGFSTQTPAEIAESGYYLVAHELGAQKRVKRPMSAQKWADDKIRLFTRFFS